MGNLPNKLDSPISNYLNYEIKWPGDMRKYAEKRLHIEFDANLLIKSLYRPFSQKWHYFSNQLNWSLCKVPDFFPIAGENRAILVPGTPVTKPFHALATSLAPSLDTLGKTQTLARYRYTKSGERIDNITDWGLSQFTAQYSKEGVTKDAIFAYCYAVLHDPVYRETYALNLKREFPRVPFYPDFAKWVDWGEALMAMHMGYGTVEPFPVERVETPSKRAIGTHPKPVLKSNSENGNIVIDADTELSGIPREAWEYRLGNRSAIDWVLDQHKEKKPKDPTIAAKFNTYRFADYKESCIELLAKVVTVSLETVKITKAMNALDRSGWDE